MKKLILFLVMTLFVISLNSQTNQTRATEELWFGVKAGVNFASITGDDTDGLSSLTGFHVGAVVDIPVSESFSVQPELIYSAQGAEYSESDGYNGKFKFDYLNIPIVAKLAVADGLFVEAGPQIGFLLSAKDEYDLIGGGESGEDDIKEFVKGTDFAVALGLSYRMQSGLSFGARYNIGLSELPEDSDDGNWKNSVFQIYIGFYF